MSSSQPPNDLDEQGARLLIEAVRDYALFRLDRNGIVRSWNPGAERIKGYRADEIIGKHFSTFYPEEDIRAGKTEHELEVAGRVGRFEDEGWRVRKDGTKFWANVIITALRDGDGNLLGFAKVTRDLSERKRAEEERLRLAQIEEAHRLDAAFLEREKAAHRSAEEARAALATTLQSIGDGVIATDEQGRVVLMNPVAEQLTGWTMSQARGMNLRGIFHIINEGTRRVVESPVDRVLREGVIVGLANHTLLIARDGTERPIHDSGAPIRDHTDSIRGVVLVFRDASQESLENARKTFLAEAAAVMALTLDTRETLARVANLFVPRLADWTSVDLVESDGRLVQVAIAHSDPMKADFARQLGRRFPPDPQAPYGAPEVVRTGQPELHARITDELLRTSAVSDEHLRILRALQMRSAIVVPLVVASKVIGVLTLVYAESGREYTNDDVEFAMEVARRAAVSIQNARLYAAEQAARDQADASSRAKDEFLALVSHELRTPLTAILGWSKMLTDGSELDPPRVRRGLETIARNAVAMTQLIEDLLDVSRIVSGKMRLEVGSVRLATVVHSAVDSIGPAANARSVTIETDVDDAVASVQGDAHRLQQVVWNLLSNAVKFTPAGGRVRVAVREVGAQVQVEVADTGKGIDPRFLPHVFEPFRQADASPGRLAGGLGLGLAIVKQLAELHGGTIEAKSEGIDRGATFIASLPKSQTRASRPQTGSFRTTLDPQAPAAPAGKLAGVRVLIVEDSDDTREMLREFLEGCSARVATASNAIEAWTALEREIPDIILCDIAMPGESGYELIGRVRARTPAQGGTVPAAALTAYAGPEDEARALAAGFDMHIRKPVDPAEVCAVVGTLARIRAPA